ncbi:hypothetical protein [Luteibacter aegosomatissinici]|uniref:hypothetical protein n=1 Tax=Luteibacter aegosomatissinici TaxID=2911539 RepID=UPI001FF9E96C|nr:hypothetical protein [Luteibacter aegosomatissinici]UPG92771.1 hypothetical protein L2Y97_12940 [Luteibacter aegosomatissinici]
MAGTRPRTAPGFLPDTLQLNRRGNLRAILLELEGDGIESALRVDQVLGLPTGTLAELREGAQVTDAMAREIEWAMNRPAGWLDRGPKDDKI